MLPTTETEELRDQSSSPVNDRMHARYDARYNESTEQDETASARFSEQRPYFHADERAKWYNTRVARQVLPSNLNVLACWIAIAVIGAYAAHEIRLDHEADAAQNVQIAGKASREEVAGKASRKDLQNLSEKLTERADVSQTVLASVNNRLTRLSDDTRSSQVALQRSVQRQLNAFDERLRQQTQPAQLRGTVTPTPAAKPPVARRNPQYVIPIEPPARDGVGAAAVQETPDGPDKAAAFPVPPGVVASKDGGNQTLWHVFANNGHPDEIATPVSQLANGFEVRTQNGTTCVLSKAGIWMSCREK